MKILIASLFSVLLSVFPQNFTNNQYSDYESEISGWQDEMNSEFKNPKESPLTNEGLKIFETLDFYSIDKKYRVSAKFERTPYEPVFGMVTTTSRLPEYKKFGVASFSIDGKVLKLNVYQNQKLINTKGYEDYLFVPYIDVTSGETSYSGGRYIDLRIPEEDIIVIDFNKSYNPYCAYNHKYSCPIPPVENTLDIKIEAGVKAYNDLGDKSH